MRKGTFWAYNLRPQESERQRQANGTAAILKLPRHGSKKKVHNQMNGQRRSGIWTDRSISHKKNKTMAYAAPQMSLEIITQCEVSQNAKDKCPMMSLTLSENS